MQRKSTRARRVFSLLWAAALLGGCGPGAATPSVAPRPFDGATVQVACPGEPSRAVVERYGRDWAARQGVRVEVTTYDSQTGPEGVAGADLWLIEPASLGRWAAAD